MMSSSRTPPFIDFLILLIYTSVKGGALQNRNILIFRLILCFAAQKRKLRSGSINAKGSGTLRSPILFYYPDSRKPESHALCAPVLLQAGHRGSTLVRGSAMFTPYLTGKHRPSGVLQMEPDARGPMFRGARIKREIPLPPPFIKGEKRGIFYLRNPRPCAKR